eukprot:CAMPEP_0183378706 /NCGR_PEP_ID=MMETSP0164_2-20130417/125055_1 /TAXON_ID=221442 /ORGANISM="Coccolithus pelagicus ssp braarudi, Strain PLY182g" /LENGTH=57 /DNA_ID=CAMNT_0025556277 /DNA_START=992 /DNA_END=1165 /DNA_ORIENTATION=+
MAQISTQAEQYPQQAHIMGSTLLQTTGRESVERQTQRVESDRTRIKNTARRKKEPHA